MEQNKDLCRLGWFWLGLVGYLNEKERKKERSGQINGQRASDEDDRPYTGIWW